MLGIIYTIETTNDENHVIQNDGGEIAAGAEHFWDRVPVLWMIRIVTFPCENRGSILRQSIKFYAAGHSMTKCPYTVEQFETGSSYVILKDIKFLHKSDILQTSTNIYKLLKSSRKRKV